jgi:Cu-Zn family superoxide dismutase
MQAVYLTSKMKPSVMITIQILSKNLLASLFVISSVGLVACGSNAAGGTATTSPQTSDQAGNVAEAVLSGTQADTSVTGTARFSEENGKVKLTLDITVPKKANQSVAVHIHEHGECGDMGKDAHGHWNPTKMNHGKWGSASFHRGDIGNVKLDANGKGSLELETDLWSISGSDTTKNIVNRAVIVHGGVDDFTTQPTGNAGSRIGCGVIKKGS